MDIPDVMIASDILNEVSLAQDYTCIYTWMHHERGLAMHFASAECVIYARIYDSSRNGTGVYCEPQSKIAKTFGFSSKAVSQALCSLVEKGLVHVVEGFGPEEMGIRAYQCDIHAANRAIAAMIDLDELKKALSEEGSGEAGVRKADSDAPVSASTPATNRRSRRKGHDELSEGFLDLLRAYPKPCSGKFVETAMAEYERLLSEGYTQEEIMKAVNDYLDEHKARNGGEVNRQFLKSLNNFLEYATGIRSFLSPIPTAEGTDILGQDKGVSFVLGTCGSRKSWIARSVDGSVIELDCPEASTKEQLSAAYERQVEARHA